MSQYSQLPKWQRVLLHPVLWRLDKIRKENGDICLTSSVTPPPTDEEIGRLVSKLTGTHLRIEDVQKEVGLEAWPAGYLALQLSSKLAIMNGLWMDAGIARQAARSDGQN